jgi:hypothetical protein
MTVRRVVVSWMTVLTLGIPAVCSAQSTRVRRWEWAAQAYRSGALWPDTEAPCACTAVMNSINGLRPKS